MPHGPTGIFVTYYFFVSIVAQTSLDVEIGERGMAECLSHGAFRPPREEVVVPVECTAVSLLGNQQLNSDNTCLSLSF